MQSNNLKHKLDQILNKACREEDLNRQIKIESDLKLALSRHRLILEATNSGGIIP